MKIWKAQGPLFGKPGVYHEILALAILALYFLITKFTRSFSKMSLIFAYSVWNILLHTMCSSSGKFKFTLLKLVYAIVRCMPISLTAFWWNVSRIIYYLSLIKMKNMKIMVLSHFSKSISQTMTFWELGLFFFGIRVILRGKLGLYAGVRFWRNGLWRIGIQPKIIFKYLFKGCNLKPYQKILNHIKL